MLLPNADRAVITAEKLRDYLLNAGHRRNRGKARVFFALGYSPEQWEVLAADLRTQHLAQEAREGRPEPHGQRFIISATLTGPTGSAKIDSVWQIDLGAEVPRFITAYPS